MKQSIPSLDNNYDMSNSLDDSSINVSNTNRCTSSLSADNLSQIATTVFNFKIKHVSICIDSDTDSNIYTLSHTSSLCLNVDDISITYKNIDKYIVNKEEHSEFNVSLRVYLSNIKLYESFHKAVNEVIPWISSCNANDSMYISNSHHISITMDCSNSIDKAVSKRPKSDLNASNIHVNMNPMIISVHLDRISFWTTLLVDTFKYACLNNNSDANMNSAYYLDISDLTVLVHPQDSLSNRYLFKDFMSALDINNYPDRWNVIDIPKSILCDDQTKDDKNPSVNLLNKILSDNDMSDQDNEYSTILCKHLNYKNNDVKVRCGIKLDVKQAKFGLFSLDNCNILSGYENQSVTMSSLTASMFAESNSIDQKSDINSHTPDEVSYIQDLRPRLSDKFEHSVYRESVFLTACHNSLVKDSRVVIRLKSLESSNSNPPSDQYYHTNSSEEGFSEGRILYGDDDALPEPKLNGDRILHLYAYRIAIDLRQREYCALINLADFFTVSESSSSHDSDSNSTTPPLNPKDGVASLTDSSSQYSNGYEVLFHSEVATVRISQNDKEYSSCGSKSPGESPTTPNGKDNVLDEPTTMCLSVSKPLIKVLSNSSSNSSNLPRQQLFFSIEAEDMSMFEMKYSKYLQHYSPNCFQSSSTSKEQLSVNNVDDFDLLNGRYSKKSDLNSLSRNSRIGVNSFLVPFLHQTSLHAKAGNWDLQYSDANPSDNLAASSSLFSNKSTNREHMFRLQLLINDESNLTKESRSSVVKMMWFHMSFQDFTLRYDPSSTWFMTVIGLLTPQTSQQILQMRGISTKCHIKRSPKSPQSNFDVKEDISVYEMTKATIRVRKCLVDYCCEQIGSRLLFSIGMLTLSTTIVSNSPKYAVKFSIRDLSLHISNTINSIPEWEQSPLDPDGYRSELSLTKPSLILSQKSYNPISKHLMSSDIFSHLVEGTGY